MTSTLHEDLRIFLTISRSVLLRTKNVSDKIVEKSRTHIYVQQHFFFFENRAVYEIMWKNNVEPNRPQTTKMAHALSMLYN
jgi:hypothetical protein